MVSNSCSDSTITSIGNRHQLSFFSTKVSMNSIEVSLLFNELSLPILITRSALLTFVSFVR